MFLPCLLLCFCSASGAALVPPDLWAWNSGNDDAALAQMEANKDLLTDVSFGAGYGLKCNASLAPACTFGASNASFPAAKDAQLRAWGLRRHALVGGGSTAALRLLFADPSAFIGGAVAEAIARRLDGYNLDFEPHDAAVPPSNADGAAYDAFQQKLQ